MHSKPGRRNKHFEIECETLKILRLIANSEPALAQMLLEQSRLNILIQSLDSPSLMARTATIDFFLIIVTVDYPTGHKLVLEAMEFFRSIRNKKRVFDYLIEALGNAVGARGIFGTFVGATPTTSTTTELSQVFRFGTEKVGKPTEKHMREYLVSCVAFIRFIVEIPPEFEYRMHIRQELISSGLQPVFQKLKTWAPSEFQDILQHVAAFESLKMADFKYLLGNLGVEMDVDLSDSNQLLNLLVSRLDTQDKTTVSSLIQNIVVGTALIDNETRSYMLSMIEKVVMYIVLDQNGITEFTDAFKYSVDQIIAGLQEIEALQVENEQLTAICEHQEKQLLSSSNTLTELENTSQVLDISSAALVQHRDKLKLIYQALEKLPSEIAQTLKGISDTPDLAKVGNDNDEKDQKEEKPAISPQDSSTTISYQATIDSGTNISKPPPPIPVSAGTGAPPPPSIPPPPPPVAAPVISIPLKYKPKTKTRKIHWERVNTTGYEESTWAKFKTYSETEEKLYKSGLLSELDTLFEAVPSAIKKESSKPKEEKEFLSADRIKNAMIFLGSLKDISVDSLIESIRIFDVSKLTDNQLNECYKFYPKDDEVILFH